MAHGDVRVQERAFLPDAAHTEPQARSRPETGGARGGDRRQSPSLPPLLLTPARVLQAHGRGDSITRKLYLSPKLSTHFFGRDLQHYIFITTQYTHTHTLPHVQIYTWKKVTLKKANLSLLHEIHSDIV